MATRSFIGLLLGDGSVKYVYCHYDGYPDGVGAILKYHYSDEGKVKQLISLGAISVLGESLGPSEVVRKYGFDFRNNSDFNNLPEDEQRTLLDNVYAYTIAYHRDRGEELYINKSASISDYMNNSDCQYKYLYVNGKWHCFDGEVEVLIPSGRAIKNSGLVGSRSLSYKYKREDALRDARRIKELINNKVEGSDFHLIVIISKSGVKLKPVFKSLHYYVDQSMGNDGEVGVYIPTFEFINSSGKANTIKHIEEVLYRVVQDRMVQILNS